MEFSQKNILWHFALLLIGVVYIFGLFIDLTGDSGLYASISRQMVESGDWINLKINSESYIQKPHLIFWLAGLGIKIFGNTNFAFKIFPILWGLAGLFFTYRLGKLLYSESVGRFAALIAGTSQIVFLYFLDIHTDSVLQTSVILSLWQLSAYLKTKRNLYFIIGFIGVGLAIFSKGPVGLIVPFFMVLFYLVFQKDYRQIFRFKWIVGIAIALLVTSPALIYLFKSFGIEGIRFFFITNNFGRISGDYAGSSTDFLFYLHTLLWAFLPWTIFAVFSIISEIKSWFSERDIWGLSLLGSVLAFTVILSIAKGKAPNYFLLAVPVISIVTAKWIFKIEENTKKIKKRLVDAQLVLLGLVAVFYLTILYIFNANWIWVLVAILTISVAVIIYQLKLIHWYKIEKVFWMSVILIGLFNLYLNASFIPGLFKYQGSKQALEIYEKNRNDGDVLKNLQLEEYELFFWANSPVEDFTTWDEMYLFLENRGSWVYTNEKGYEVILEIRNSVDKVFPIPQYGLNHISLSFLNPKTREATLKNNYLIKINDSD